MIAKVTHSLTAKIFLITFLLLVTVCVLTYGFIAWVMPLTYTADRQQALALQMEQLARQLENSSLEDCDVLLDAFTAENDAQAVILDPAGKWVKGDALSGLEEMGDWIGLGSQSGEDNAEDIGSAASLGAQSGEDNAEDIGNAAGLGSQSGEEKAENAGDTGNVASLGSQSGENEEISLSILGDGDTSVVQTIGCGFYFPGLSGEYQLMVLGSTKAVNQAVEALGRVWPFLAAAILLVSMLSALFYTRFITRPIMDISAVSQKLSERDLSWRCREDRFDEIGTLARNLNQLTDRLSAAMEELKNANAALQGDIERERKLEQAQMDFFSAASHELKTPLTILKGQLGGMLDGVGRYVDRDRWLARSLEVVSRMERLVRELLTVSRMNRDGSFHAEPVELSVLVQECVQEYVELFEQREQQVTLALDDGVQLEGDTALFKKAVCNLLSNAVFYSPEGAAVHMAVYREGDKAVLTVENEGVSIAPESLPHLFEAFYRVDPSRSRQTGGSGLGLYLVKTIAERYGGDCVIRNTERGVETRLALSVSTENTSNV